MSEMVDRVAQILADRTDGCIGNQAPCAPDCTCVETARVVIATILEPVEAMVSSAKEMTQKAFSSWVQMHLAMREKKPVEPSQ